MTAYSDFIQDFPGRCIDILDKYIEGAKQTNREVTLMLVVASAALTIPFERLRDNDHIAGNVRTYKDASASFNKKVHEKFSTLQGQGKSWKCIESVDKKDFDKGIDSVVNGNPKDLPEGYTIDKVLALVRNALAHGNIFTYPSQAPQIEIMVFISEKREDRKPTGKYNGLLVSPDDFLIFLKWWVEFLKSLKLKASV